MKSDILTPSDLDAWERRCRFFDGTDRLPGGLETVTVEELRDLLSLAREALALRSRVESAEALLKTGCGCQRAVHDDDCPVGAHEAMWGSK